MHEFVYNSTKYKLTDKYYIGLYAWTTNKILFNDFIDFRTGAKDMYEVIIKKKKEFTKEEFRAFRIENFHEELMYYRIPVKTDKWDSDDEYNTGYEPNKKDKENEEFFKFNKKYSQIVCTKFEYEELFEHAQQNLFDYMAQIISADYIVLKQKYQLLLDKLGYCDIFNNMHDGLDSYDEQDDYYYSRYEATEFNRSYNLTCYGNPYILFRLHNSHRGNWCGHNPYGCPSA